MTVQPDERTSRDYSVAGFPEADRRSYKSVVLEALIDDIVRGTLAPGEKLSESRLAERFGMSRMPVREALIELNRRGLVRVVPQVGTFVTEVTEEEVLSLFEVREALEVEAARLAALRRSEESLSALKDLVARMRTVVELESSRHYVALDEEFHNQILLAAANAPLHEHYRILMGALRREYLSLVVSTRKGRMLRSCTEHEAVLHGIELGDADASGTAMRAHVTSGRIELQEALSARSKKNADEQ